MADPIEVNYTRDGDDWAVQVTGRGQTLTGTAPGLIAARDRADQLVEEIAPEEGHKTVVHLLDGDALEFTTAYLTARLAKSEPEPQEQAAEPPQEEEPTPAPRAESDTPAPPAPSPRQEEQAEEAASPGS